MEAEAEAKRILKMEAGAEVVQKLGASTSLVRAFMLQAFVHPPGLKLAILGYTDRWTYGILW